ncbi:MAG: S8/S53 family peptidase [Calditrichia bacterium]
MQKWIAVFILILTGWLFPATAAPAEISPALQQVMLQAGSDTQMPVWIFFNDKGSRWEQKLPQVKADLLTKAKARRLRNRPADKLVDFYDLPVKPEYIQQVKGHVIRIRHKSRWLNAVSAEIRPAQLETLQTLPFIKKIDVVHKSKMVVPQEKPLQKSPQAPLENQYSLSYGSSLTQNQQIHTPELHDLGYNGSGVLICMLDAGFNNLQHEALAPINILQTWDFVNGDSIVWDEPGQAGTGTHGTYTLGTIAGYYPGELIGPAYGADFVLAKTENTDWEHNIEEDHWVAGAEWGDSLGADIISSSLGYREFDFGQISYTWQDMDGNTTVVTRGADLAASRGILVVNSAGNEGPSTTGNPNTLVAPSDGDSVLAAGAVSASGSQVYFSSMGPTADGRIKPDVMAMGSGVVAPSTFSTNGYSSVDGTSFSCPLTAGAAALVLQANPNLTNMQIIEAMRQTADNAAAPNNAYGWGILNAYQAAFYYTPQITHTPLPDVEDLAGPYTVDVEISSRFPLNSDSLRIYFRYDSLAYQHVPLQNISGNQYQALMPGPGSPAEVSYYIYAATDSGGFSMLPASAPQETFRFHAGPDQIPPVIVHHALQQVALLKWPSIIQAYITDNLGVDDSQVRVEWKLNSQPQADFPLLPVQDSLFAGYFNSDTSQVSIGDVIEYRILAADSAQVPNTVVHPASGYHQFTILETRGLVLVLDDETGSRGMIKDRGITLSYAPEKTRSASGLIQHYLEKMNFLVTVETSASTNVNNWSQYNLIISASGENPSPVSDPVFRQALEQHVQSGGKLLIEGGEVGYDAVSSPGYPSFASQVLHITDWNGDDEGSLRRIAAQAQHPMLNVPNLLPNIMILNYNSSSGWYDQDAVTPDAQSYILYEPELEAGKAGILVYDDNSYPESAQTVYYAFDFSSITDTTAAKNLLDNTLTFLMTDDTPTEIGGAGSMVAENLQLYANYPNPFNPATTISYFLPQAEKVRITVYNSLGQKVIDLFNNRQTAGSHRLQWNAADLGSGVYFIELKAGKQRLLRKALLMK